LRVTHPNGEPLSGKCSVCSYGSDTDLVTRFGLDQKLIVIPVEEEAAIRVEAHISVPRISHTLTTKGKAGYFKLSQGETLHIDSMEYILDCSVEKMKQTWDSAFYLFKDVEHIGFLVSAERQDLTDAYGLIDASSMRKRLYDEAFAKLRNAYVLTSGTTEKLQGLIYISSLSAFLLMPILAFIASSSA